MRNREKRKEERKLAKNKTAFIREKSYTRGGDMVEKIHTIRQNDAELYTMTTDKDIKAEHRDERDELEIEIKHMLISALGKAAVIEMTKMVRQWPEQNEQKLTLSTSRSSFHTRKKNVSQSGWLFWDNTKTEKKTAEVWTLTLQMEKNCVFDNVAPGELIAANILSLIRKWTGNYEFERKIEKVTWPSKR